jgi:hypothetical protein
MRRLDFTQLKRTAAQINRIANNEKPREHNLNDPLDDMFPEGRKILEANPDFFKNWKP